MFTWSFHANKMKFSVAYGEDGLGKAFMRAGEAKHEADGANIWDRANI